MEGWRESSRKGQQTMGGVEIGVIVAAVLVALVVIKSLHSIGAAEVGLVSKRFGFRKLSEDNPVAFRGEAGYRLPSAYVRPNCAIELQQDLLGFGLGDERNHDPHQRGGCGHRQCGFGKNYRLGAGERLGPA